MTDIAFLFPGQGSQSVGMGKLLFDESPAGRSTFEEADDALQFPLSRLCFEGPEQDLVKTENTQPALLAVSIAALRVLAEHGYHPALVAGHSLGEYTALVAAQSLNFADALRLVRKRGRYMQHAVPEGIGAMAAILKLPAGKLNDILAAAAQGEVVSAANLNSPQQIVIAGHAGAVARAMELAKEAGAGRVKALAVSAPFHCALMLPAQQQLRADLDAAPFGPLHVPLINNWQARRITAAEEARTGLYEQIPNPVRWSDSIGEMARLGFRRFIEVGPGSVLSGLCRSIDPTLHGARFEKPGDIGGIKALFEKAA